MIGNALYVCAFFLLISTRILAEQGGPKFSDNFADLVLTGGTVATVDEEMSIAEAIAMRHGAAACSPLPLTTRRPETPQENL